MAPQTKPDKTVSGSPAHGEPVYLVVGRLRRTHGVHGELVMEVHTDFPERLQPETRVFIGSAHEAMLIASVRHHGQGLLIRLHGLDTPDAAARYRNQLVFVTAADRPPLPEGYFYVHQLLGAEVIDEERGPVGRLSEVLHTGANDVYVVTRPDGGELLLPVIPSVVLEVSAERHVIRVKLIDGLLDARPD